MQSIDSSYVELQFDTSAPAADLAEACVAQLPGLLRPCLPMYLKSVL